MKEAIRLHDTGHLTYSVDTHLSVFMEILPDFFKEALQKTYKLDEKTLEKFSLRVFQQRRRGMAIGSRQVDDISLSIVCELSDKSWRRYILDYRIFTSTSGGFSHSLEKDLGDFLTQIGCDEEITEKESLSEISLPAIQNWWTEKARIDRRKRKKRASRYSFERVSER